MNLSDIEFNRINELICKIYVPGNSCDVRKQIMEILNILIPYDFGDFCSVTVNEDGSFEVIDPVYISRFGDSFQKDFEKAYQEKYSSFDYTKWYINHERSIAFIESELIHRSARTNTVFYKELLEPRGLIYSLGAYLISKETAEIIGAIALYRGHRSEDFNHRDLDIMNIMLPHITQSLENCIKFSPRQISGMDLTLMNIHELTRREIDIIHEIRAGLTNEEIAASLNLSTNTVKKHLYNIYQKMDVPSRAKLVNKLEKIK